MWKMVWGSNFQIALKRGINKRRDSGWKRVPATAGIVAGKEKKWGRRRDHWAFIQRVGWVPWAPKLVMAEKGICGSQTKMTNYYNKWDFSDENICDATQSVAKN